jgi:hypothetical protein
MSAKCPVTLSGEDNGSPLPSLTKHYHASPGEQRKSYSSVLIDCCPRNVLPMSIEQHGKVNKCFSEIGMDAANTLAVTSSRKRLRQEDDSSRSINIFAAKKDAPKTQDCMSPRKRAKIRCSAIPPAVLIRHLMPVDIPLVILPPCAFNGSLLTHSLRRDSARKVSSRH